MPRLWHVPDPWDYHKEGGYIVLAESKEEAREKIEALLRRNHREWNRKFYKTTFQQYTGGKEPKWEETTEVKGGLYRLSGCDD